MVTVLQSYLSMNLQERFIKLSQSNPILLGTKFMYDEWRNCYDYSGYEFNPTIIEDYVIINEPNIESMKRRLKISIPVEDMKELKEEDLGLDLRISGFSIEPIPGYFSVQNSSMYYLVAFNPPDILFYDGNSVFVRRFMIVGKRFIEYYNPTFFEYYPELERFAKKTDALINRIIMEHGEKV